MTARVDLLHTLGMRSLKTIAFQAGALMGAALLGALVSNHVARPERHLPWRGAPMAPAIALPPAPSTPTPPPPVPDLSTPAQRTPLRPLAPLPPRPPLTPQPEPFAARPGQPVREVNSEEAFSAFKAAVPFLDARRSAEYELGHIAGAWSLPVWEGSLEDRLVAFEANTNRPPEAPLVLYCSGNGCEDSHLLATRLFKLGYRNLLIYLDGYPDWAAQGRPTTKGASR